MLSQLIKLQLYIIQSGWPGSILVAKASHSRLWQDIRAKVGLKFSCTYSCLGSQPQIAFRQKFLTATNIIINQWFLDHYIFTFFFFFWLGFTWHQHCKGYNMLTFQLYWGRKSSAAPLCIISGCKGYNMVTFQLYWWRKSSAATLYINFRHN